MPIVQCHITKVEREEGSEWGAIHTDDSTVKKLTTKKQDLLREAAAFKAAGVLVGIDYTDKSRTVDTEGGPRTYRNFYYNSGAALGNGASPSDDGIEIVPKASAGGGGREDPERSWRICLQSGGKLALATMPLMDPLERDFETQKVIARAWAEFFYFTPAPDRPIPTVELPSMTASAYHDEPQGFEQPPPRGDDDIPF